MTINSQIGRRTRRVAGALLAGGMLTLGVAVAPAVANDSQGQNSNSQGQNSNSQGQNSNSQGQNSNSQGQNSNA